MKNASGLQWQVGTLSYEDIDKTIQILQELVEKYQIKELY
jgi:hypothetical protein